ncbi:MAG TPA: FtsX-like permease family protein [Anaerolineales bacterium]|nr:FtsX-like permease family protein [Anaerolineales bacterium]
MNLQLTLAARYLNGRKLRTLLTTLAVVFGVVVIFGMNIILPTMLTALQANVQGAEGNVDFSITHISGEPFPQTIADKLQGVDGVRVYAASLTRTLNIPANFYDKDASKVDTITALSLTGIDPEAAHSIRAFAIVEGRYLKANDTSSAIISRTLADSLKVGVGDTFIVPSVDGTTELTIAGILPAQLTGGNEEVLVNLPEAQLITNEPGKVNIIDINTDTMALEERRAEVQKNIETALGSDYQVGTLVAGSEIYASLRLGQVMFTIFGVLALFMGGFIIFNTFRTIIAERRRDIGMLRALGANRSTIIGMILAEGFLQGIIGTGLGLLIGYLVGIGIIKIAGPVISSFINLNLGAPVVTPTLLIGSIILGVGVTVLAGLIPAVNASKVTPLEALRPSVADSEFNQRTGFGFVGGVVIVILTVIAILTSQPALIIPGGFLFLVGLVLIAPALVRPFALVFGRITALIYARQGIGELAQGNIVRQPSRVAVTASTSMIALAIIVAMGGMVSSLTVTLYDLIRDNLGSDYLFVPPSIALWGSNVPVKPEFAESLKAVDGVETVSTFRFANATVDGQAISVLGIDPVSFPAVSGLYFQDSLYADDDSAYASLTEGRNMFVNGSLMTTLGIQVGDTVEVTTPDGMQQYHIVAMATDMLNAKITTAYISQANLQTDFGATDDVFIQLNLKKDADRAAADKSIKALAENYPTFKVVSGIEYYESLRAQMDTAFSALYILFLLLAVPSLIAMLNTLTISVIERTREIGMIRATGGTRKQVRNMVMIEALLLAAIGTSLGILGGLYLGYVIVVAMEAIFPLGYVFPASGILAAIAIGLLFGVFAAVIPARQASRMNVVEALRYE